MLAVQPRLAFLVRLGLLGSILCALPTYTAAHALVGERDGRLPAQTGHGEDSVTLRGRAIDEDARPFADQELSADLWNDCKTGSGGSSSSTGSWPKTDAQGRFEVRVARDVDTGCTRSLQVRPSWRKTPHWNWETEPSVHIDLPNSIETSTLDLGDLRLVSQASPKRFATLSDDKLARAIQEFRDGKSNGGREGRYFDALMCEVARRDGAQWAAFLAEEMRRVLPESERQRFEFDLRNLELLTTLRRLQKRPDPLSIQVQDESQLDAEYPESPTFRVHLANVDADCASITITDGGGYRSGRLERWRIDVRTLDGAVVAPVEWGTGMGGGLSVERTLAPGEFLEEEIPLSNYVLVPAPGVYEARLLYHDQDSIADAHDLGNLILASSPWVGFEVRSRTITIKKAEEARIREILANAGEPDRVFLLHNTYRPTWTFDAEPANSDIALCFYGWKSLSVLFDALDNPALTPRKRAWVLAQLYNLTGLNNPARSTGVVGNYEYGEGGGKVGLNSAAMLFPSGGAKGSGPIDEANQREFAKRWKPMRLAFRFERTD